MLQHHQATADETEIAIPTTDLEKICNIFLQMMKDLKVPQEVKTALSLLVDSISVVSSIQSVNISKQII